MFQIALSSLDVLFIPVHTGSQRRGHWSLCVVYFALKKIVYYCSLGARNPECLRVSKALLTVSSLGTPLLVNELSVSLTNTGTLERPHQFSSKTKAVKEHFKDREPCSFDREA